jgi:hypothetical protein
MERKQFKIRLVVVNAVKRRTKRRQETTRGFKKNADQEEQEANTMKSASLMNSQEKSRKQMSHNIFIV